jgi:acyl-coenzyme A synthetase/AMP-(fatty) acid ligase
MTLLQYLKDNNITAIIWVASALSQLAALGATEACPPTHLRLIGFGSEVFPRMYYDRWRAALPDTEFYQLYGPTEATGMSCIWRADRLLDDGEKIPIGAPLDNTDAILIGDDGARIVPCRGSESAMGELYLRGTCLTLGYCAAPAQTKTAFVQNPLHDDYPETVYRTGDMAAYNAHGELVFFGRRDAQIKRMGHRIETGEIEVAALRCDGVSECACVARASDGDVLLCYAGEALPERVMDTLRAYLPRYMLPRACCALPTLPRTENGKIDRRALGRSAWGELYGREDG